MGNCLQAVIGFDCHRIAATAAAGATVGFGREAGFLARCCCCGFAGHSKVAVGCLADLGSAVST